jgi:intracellular septation protein
MLVNRFMHPILEFLPLVIFFAIYKIYGIYWATASLIITSALQIVYFLVKKQKVPSKYWILFVLITVLGGLTIFLQNDAFLKWKVTIINVFFALALLISQQFFKKNLIKKFLGDALTLPENIWARLNTAWAIFFALCGILNIYVAYNFEQETWVNFKVFGLTGLMFIFVIGSIASLHKYLPKENDDSK